MNTESIDPMPAPYLLEWQSEGGNAKALLLICESNKCIIRLIEAIPQKQGYGRRALQELRDKFSSICVSSIGDESHCNRNFWLKMREEGLVDELYDDDGCIVPQGASD